MKKNSYSKIKNLSDIKRYKRILNKRIRIRQRVLLRKINVVKNVATPTYFYEQFLKGVDMENSVFTMLPFVAKLGSPVLDKFKNSKSFKKFIPIVSGLIIVSAGLFAFIKRRKNKRNTTVKTDEELFI